jgi:protein SCO1/2
MTAPSPKYQALVWGGLGLVVLVITLSFAKSALSDKPSPASSLAADVQTLSLTNQFGDVPDFRLTNQLGQIVTRESLLGHPWLCDVIFTRCPSQCLRMTRLMADVQKALPANTAVRLVSLTADPAFDQPPALKKYGDRFGADSKEWFFLTGAKADVYHLAAEHGLKFVVAEKKPSERDSENDLFIHTTKIVLVDKGGRIRGWLSSEDPGSLQTILDAAARLSAE